MSDALRCLSFIIPPATHAFATGAVVLLVLAACSRAEARAQNLVRMSDAAPPVLYVPADARASLAAEERDLKKRARISLELADARLQMAADLTAQEQYGNAAGQLGVYQALVADLIKYLRQNGKQNNRTRDLSKRVEITLRSHIPRVETIRRTTPSEEALHVRAVIDYLRVARAEALNTFYGDTVMPDNFESPSGRPAGAAQPFKEPAQTPPNRR